MLGISFADSDQFFDHHTWQLHEAPYATSDLEFKSALRDNARTVYSGLIKVSRAPRRRTPTSRTEPRPQPRCPGRLDPEPRDQGERRPLHPRRDDLAGGPRARLLPQARGIPRTEAQKLIVEGFFRPVIDRIPVEEIQGFLQGAIARKVGL
jgi:Fe-S cluster assembly protein SufD